MRGESGGKCVEWGWMGGGQAGIVGSTGWKMGGALSLFRFTGNLEIDLFLSRKGIIHGPEKITDRRVRFC